MAKIKKSCRICGKEYTPCSYCENDKMAFHYRTICCSRECAQIYLARVLEARQKSAKTNSTIKEDINVVIEQTSTVQENPVESEVLDEKSKRKYTKKKPIESESENIEQIDESVGTID